MQSKSPGSSSTSAKRPSRSSFSVRFSSQSCSPSHVRCRPGRVWQVHHAPKYVFPAHSPSALTLSRLSARLLSDLLPSRNSDMEGHHPAQSHRVSPIARIYSSPHFSTAPSRGCLPSSKTSLRALSLAAPQLPQVAHPPPVTRSRARAPPLRPATSFPPPSQHHPGRVRPSSGATPPIPP